MFTGIVQMLVVDEERHLPCHQEKEHDVADQEACAGYGTEESEVGDATLSAPCCSADTPVRRSPYRPRRDRRDSALWSKEVSPFSKSTDSAGSADLRSSEKGAYRVGSSMRSAAAPGPVPPCCMPGEAEQHESNYIMHRTRTGLITRYSLDTGIRPRAWHVPTRADKVIHGEIAAHAEWLPARRAGRDSRRILFLRWTQRYNARVVYSRANFDHG